MIGPEDEQKYVENYVFSINSETDMINIDKENGFLKSVNLKESEQKIEADMWIDVWNSRISW